MIFRIALISLCLGLIATTLILRAKGVIVLEIIKDFAEDYEK